MIAARSAAAPRGSGRSAGRRFDIRTHRADRAAGTAGNSGLQYNKAAGTYTFTGKTARAFAGTCQVFSLGLNDGTFRTANFQFTS